MCLQETSVNAMDERDIELPSWVLFSRLLLLALVSNSDVNEFCFLMSFVSGEVALPRWAVVAKGRSNETVVPDLSTYFLHAYPEFHSTFFAWNSVVRLFFNSVSSSCSKVERYRYLLYTKKILYPLKLCLKVLEPCAQDMVQILRQFVMTASVRPCVLSDALENLLKHWKILQVLRFVFMFPERERERDFFF